MFNQIHYKLELRSTDADEAREAIEMLRNLAIAEPFESVSDIVDIAPKDQGIIPESGAIAHPDGHGETRISSGFVFSTGGPNDWAIQDAIRGVRGDSIVPVKPTRVIAFKAEPGRNSERVSIGLTTYPSHVGSGGNRIATGLPDWSWSSYCDTSRLDKGKPTLNPEHRLVVTYLEKVANHGLLTAFLDRTGFSSMSGQSS